MTVHRDRNPAPGSEVAVCAAPIVGSEMRHDLTAPRRRRRPRQLMALLAGLALVAVACAEEADDEAIAACTTFQDHLASMRQDDGREQGLRLARAAAETAEQSEDAELADAFDDYHRVIVRFALAEDDVQAAQDQMARADEPEQPRVEGELEEAEDRLSGLVEAGDLVLAHINEGCGEHGVPLE